LLGVGLHWKDSHKECIYFLKTATTNLFKRSRAKDVGTTKLNIYNMT